MNVLVLNDTSRAKGHLGCRIVMKNINTLLKKYGADSIYYIKDIHENYDRSKFYEILKKIDIVVVNGEGTLHHNAGIGIYQRCIQASEINKKIYLINTVWQDNLIMKKYLYLFEKIFVRESYSYNEIVKDGYINAKIVPDLSLYGEIDITINRNNEIIFFDSVDTEVGKKILELAIIYKSRFLFMGNWRKTLMRRSYPLLYYRGMLRLFRNMYCIEDEKEISKVKLIVTGRFHALCLALKYRTPFLAYSSNTHKIEAILHDIGLDSNIFILNQNTDISVFSHINMTEYIGVVDNYVKGANMDIEKMFLEIMQ